MQDLRHLQEMGLMQESFVDEIQEVIEKSDGFYQIDPIHYTNNLHNAQSNKKQIPKHKKPPLAKNIAKRNRSRQHSCVD